MMIPKQLLALRRLTEFLEGINPDNEDPSTGEAYTYDLRKAVFRGRTTLGDNDPYPALSLLESPKPEIGEGAGHENAVRLEDWTLLLQGFADDDKKNPTDPAYWLKAVVEQRLSRIIAINEGPGMKEGDPLFPDDYMLGRLFAKFTIGQGVVRPPTVNVSPTAFFYLPLVVRWKTDVRQPYQADA